MRIPNMKTNCLPASDLSPMSSPSSTLTNWGVLGLCAKGKSRVVRVASYI